MKKLIALIAFAAVTSFAKAQTPAAIVMPVTSASFSNTGSDTATSKATNAPNLVSIQPVITKISGTVAGKAFIYASLDGVAYQKLTIDSVVLTNQTTNTKIINITPSKYLYYRVIVTGTGTMAASYRSLLYAK